MRMYEFKHDISKIIEACAIAGYRNRINSAAAGAVDMQGKKLCSCH